MRFDRILINAAALGAVMVLVACGGPTTGEAEGSTSPSGLTGATSGPGIDDVPVELRLAVADPKGRQSAPAARYFADRVEELSGGSITVTVKFQAGEGTPEKFELGVAEMIKRGDAELGMTATRAWDLAGVTSLQALQAPFLIDNDALALAVAKSAIAEQALAGMESVGVIGLALWPEDLRHLFQFPDCGRDFRSADSLKGATLRVIASAASEAVINSLGATDYKGEDVEKAARTCDVQGFETGLMGVGLPVDDSIVGGNLVLFPKYQMLSMNGAVSGRLSVNQQEIIRKASTDTMTDAFTRQPKEVDLGRARCDQGGSVVSVAAHEVAAYAAAAAPVYDRFSADPLTADLIERIRELKAATAPSSPAAACGPAALNPPPPLDLTGFSGAVPPDGTYRMELPESTLLARGATPGYATINEGTWTLVFEAGVWRASHRDGARDEDCDGTYESLGDFVRMKNVHDLTCGYEYDFMWQERDGGLVLYPPTWEGWSDREIIDDSAGFLGWVWTRID